MWSDPILLSLFRRFPPEEKEIIFKEPDTRPADEYELEATRPFHEWFEMGATEMFDGKDVFDLGSGFGGTAVRYLEYGARSVVGMEISAELVEHATRFAEERRVSDRVRFVEGFGEELPLGDGEFDLVTMYDVMEHVVDPRKVVDEAYRVLRPGGLFAVVFPPYYDVTAGSHLHGYATRLPGLNLVFTTRQLKSAATKLFEEQGVDWRHYMREVPSDKLWNQNGLTTAGFRRLVRESRFEPVEMRYLGHRDPRTGNNNPGVDGPVQEAAVRVNRALAQVPVVQEAVCSRVAALLRK